ncbi:hypothetical protein [Malacoplasma penetrans HF-2]|uniref:Uncharacterized protein n=1 Tax=Malacoplasma penetrans (strain HF-2) TaxID=272633 RepID=Q8EW44_MALP2|nr:hypothetical protein [Malacoplasma penetrans]BAC44152.1 hypothetical protein [Malacoplasma penetrans HF-2]
MKKRNTKFLLSSLTLLSLSAIPVAGISSINSMNSNLSKVDSDLQATAARNITVNTLEMRLKKDYNKLSWYGKNFANTATEAQLKELIVPNKKYDANYGINILTSKDQALANGYVEFTVYQIKNEFNNGVTTKPGGSGSTSSTTPVEGRTDIAPPTTNITFDDGSSSSIDMRAYTTNGTDDVEINGKVVKKSMVWTTKNIGGLFLEYKYNFSWNNNEKIGDFLRDTSKSTLNAQDVYTNLISRSKITDILPADTATKTGIITFSQEDAELTSYGITNADAKRYGIGVVKVDFSKSDIATNADNWVNKKVPNDEKYLVRGLMPSNGSSSKEEMKLNIDEGTNSFLNTPLSVEAIKKQNRNFKLPSGETNQNATSVKISQFTPSELINALTTSSNGSLNLLDLLTKKDYLDTSSTNQLPALYLTYMGKTTFGGRNSNNTSTQWNGTGLNKMGEVPTVKNGVVDYINKSNPANTSNITNVLATADNANGQLYLNITYNKFNVYQNTVEMGVQTSIVISGLQPDDSESLNNKNLFFQWKSIDQLAFGSVQDVMDLYNNNKDNAVYLKSLSNLFFEGSQNTYSLDRTVTIQSSGNNLTVTLNFPKYGDINGGWTFTNTYTLSGQTASAAGITFKSQSEVTANIRRAFNDAELSTITPSQVINQLNSNNTSGRLSLSDFYTASGSSTSALILQSDTNDGIVIQVISTQGSNTYRYSYIYNGMSQGTSTSHIYNFAFGAQDSGLEQGLLTLRNIPIDLITKEDVYNYYVSKLPIYSGTDKLPLTINDFEITKDLDTNSITISINVAIVADGSENGTKTYSNTLKGFTKATIVNSNSNTIMQNLTIPLSVSFALAIVLIMSGLITHQIIKRKKLAKSKINLKDIRKSTKK